MDRPEEIIDRALFFSMGEKSIRVPYSREGITPLPPCA
jgi:hypothetical protein